MEFNYIVMLVCLALAIFMVVKEISRRDKSNLIFRLLATFLMSVCFALLIIPISYSIKKQEPAHEINLLTEGVATDTIANIKGVKYDLDSTLFPAKKGVKINHLADLNYFLATNPAVKKINIYGYGLADEQLKKLTDYQLIFHPSAIPSGIISASWPQKLKFSESLKVQGVYNNTSNKSVKLKLFGMGLNLDSVTVKPNSTTDFSFNSLPKQDGKAVFNLIALQGNDTLAVEPVPFEVEKKQPLKVLILASFPDFEYKFLKKWLYENQFTIAVRNQISKNKYSTDFLNMKAVNLNQINQALLKNFDLVIIDEDELAAISATNKSSIYNEVNNGLGLIVRVTNAKPIGQNFNQYEVLSPMEKPLSLKTSDNLKFGNLNFKQTLFLKAVSNTEPIIVDETGKILVSSQLNGMGKVLSLAFLSTYQWQLAGKQNDYSRFWSLLLTKSSKKRIENQSFSLAQFASIEEKTRLLINVADNKAPQIALNEVKISPRQNMEISFEWDGYFWAKTDGWHNLSINQKTANVYFYKKTDWATAKNFNKVNHTANFSTNQLNKNLKSDKIDYLVKEIISKWWFFVGFLLSISFLWYEHRFLANK